ncbi:hypothetical protein BX600DRAFT_459777 [Xylariales sp. PMI_506]|nr:hypothetical protein BX600DRAFT_459777 [Xylariales sp. PMI_506]
MARSSEKILPAIIWVILVFSSGPSPLSPGLRWVFVILARPSASVIARRTYEASKSSLGEIQCRIYLQSIL